MTETHAQQEDPSGQKAKIHEQKLPGGPTAPVRSRSDAPHGAGSTRSADGRAGDRGRGGGGETDLDPLQEYQDWQEVN